MPLALVLLAGSYVLGVVAAAVLDGQWWLSTTLASLMAVGTLLYRPRFDWLPVLAAAVLLAGAGHARLIEHETAAPPPIAGYAGAAEVVGVVATDPRISGMFARFDLDVERINADGVDGRLRVTMPALLEPVRRGERLRLRGEIEPPPQLDEFDYAAFLRTQGIYMVMGFPADWDRLGDARTGWRAALLEFRRWSLKNTGRSLPDPAATLAAGVLFGEQRAMPPDVLEALRVTGTTHLVVVSGLHVAMTLGVVIALLSAVMSRRLAGLVALAFLPLYLALVGLDPPVVRASIMAVGVAAAAVLGRRTPGWIYLVYAVAAMLLVDPGLIRTAAFQFSAAATAGVMLVGPVLRDWLLLRTGWTEETGRAAIVEAGAAAAGASLAVAPIQVATFQYVSLWEVPTNILVAPLFEGTLFIAAIAAFTGWWPPAADAMNLAGRFVPDAFIAVVTTMASLPRASIDVTAPLPAGIGFYGALVGAVWWLERRTGPAPALDPGRRSGIEWTASLAVIAGGLWLIVLNPADDTATVTIFDVGQGSAALIREGNTQVLVDTGLPDGAIIGALGRVGAARGIDAVILSHEDADHAGGLYPLLRRMDVHGLYATADALAALDFVHGVPLTIGDRVHLSTRVFIEVLSPPTRSNDRRHASPNEASLVVMVHLGERRVLLPGDIEAGGEDWLVRSGLDLRADVIAIPHHGSRTSSTSEFVARVSPAVAVASVGVDNRYGHPHEEVIARYRGAIVYRTDEAGDIIIRSDGDRLWVQTQRPVAAIRPRRRERDQIDMAMSPFTCPRVWRRPRAPRGALAPGADRHRSAMHGHRPSRHPRHPRTCPPSPGGRGTPARNSGWGRHQPACPGRPARLCNGSPVAHPRGGRPGSTQNGCPAHRRRCAGQHGSPPRAATRRSQ